MTTETIEYCGAQKPNTRLYFVTVMPALYVMFASYSNGLPNSWLIDLPAKIAVAVVLIFLVYYFSPKLTPKKLIRLDEGFLSMHQDEAVHWHIPFSEIKHFDIQRRKETAFKSRAKMLNIYNQQEQKIIEQELEFLSKDQQILLLDSLKEACAKA